MGNIYTLVLQDELPKFGSGHRRIEVVKVGPKWVTLACGSKRQRVSIEKWLQVQIASRAYHQRHHKELSK